LGILAANTLLKELK